MRRRNFNRIFQIKKPDENIIIDEKDIKNKAIQFYERLLTIDQKDSTHTRNKILHNISTILTDRKMKFCMNKLLMRK